MLHEGLESDHQVGGDKLGVTLDAVLDEATASRIFRKSHVGEGREVSV